MDNEQLQKLLQQVKAEDITINDAVEKLRHLPFEDIGFARIDHHRQIRCGFPEVIYCPGKTNAQIVEIFDRLSQKGNNVLASRAEKNIYEELKATGKYPNLQYEELARMVILKQKDIPQSKGFIAIVTAGTADMPVATEAKVTAEILGQRTKLICDVGVAGLHRIIGNITDLQLADVVIVTAGMEGALASVVGGMVDCPVIAVPTSVGYGASFDGLAALLAMLNSCASGVTVVNIDNGFGAAYAASTICREIAEKGEI